MANKKRLTFKDYYASIQSEKVNNPLNKIAQKIKAVKYTDVVPTSDIGRTDVVPIRSLSKTQTHIYNWLKNRGEIGDFNKKEINSELTASYITIRRSLNILKKYGIINLNFDKCRNIYEYKIFLSKKVKKARIINRYSNRACAEIEPSIDQACAEIDPSIDQACAEIDPSLDKNQFRFFATSSSSSFSTKGKTTTNNLANLLENTSELGYWQQKGLTEKQFKAWLKTANCNEKTMLRYLSYCRFDMVDLGFEESKPVDNVFNWFFKILQKTGGYPKPKGYKSFEEKRMEEEQKAMAEQKRIAEKQESIYREKIKAKRDSAFWKMMNDSNSSEYKQCFDKLNNFMKKRKGTTSFELSMRSEFDKMLEKGEEEKVNNTD